MEFNKDFLRRKLKHNFLFSLAYKNFKVRTNYFKQIRENILSFKNDSSFIFQKENVSQGGKIVMVISQSDFIYSAKIELMLSFALKRKNWDVVFLLKKSSYWAENLFRWANFGSIIYYEDFITSEIQRNSEKYAKEYLSKNLNFSNVREWRYKESWIGPQILSTISRLQNQGMPDPSSVVGRQILNKILPEIILAIEVSENIVNKIKPNYCLVNEPNYDLNGAMVDTLIFKDIKVIHYSQPSRDDSLILFKLTKDTRRLHPSTILKSRFESISQFDWNARLEEKLNTEFNNRYNGKFFLQSRNQPNIDFFEKDAILSKLGILSSGKRVVCIFSPVLWDANLFYGEDLFNDFEDWLIETIRCAIRNKEVIWLLKLHPANIWKLKRSKLDSNKFSELDVINKNFGVLPDHIKLLMPDCGISTLGLYSILDISITVRGTAGMEAPCFGKLSITAGTGRYSDLGFTLDSKTKTDYLDKISNVQNLKLLSEVEIIRAKKYALLSFCARGWKMETFKSKFIKMENGSHPLDHDLEYCQNCNFRDLDLFAEWVDSENLDYLDESFLLNK